MPGPTLTASGFTKQASGQDTVPLTYTFTTSPVAGDVIVVKLDTWDTNATMGAPSGGSQTYSPTKVIAPGGFNQWCALYTCKVTGTPGNFTITSTPASSSRHSMEVEHWTGANLAGTPATNSTTTGTGTAQASLTTTGPNSVISWTSGDVSSADPSGKTALSNNTFEAVRDDHVGANGVDYHGYMTTTTAGSYTFGMSAPTGQTYVIAGVEILAGSSTTPFTKDVIERYRVFNAVTKDVIERYRVTNVFTKDVVETYRVLNSITKDVIERYRVTNTWTKDVVETYRVFGTWAKDVVETYRVLNALAKDVIERYRVFNSFTKDTVETYRVLNGWTKDITEQYRVLNIWTKDVLERYDVLSGTAFTKDVIERYRILNGFAKDTIERYRVFGIWSVDTTERYRVFNAWVKNVVERYSILTTTPFVKDIVERYSILGVAHTADAIVDLRPMQAVVTISPAIVGIIVNLAPSQATANLD